MVGSNSSHFPRKKQGAAGITTAAPYVTGQWGRGDNRLRMILRPPNSFQPVQNFFAHG